MKPSAVVFAALSLFPPIVLSQTNPGPSPTNSYGCEAHDDCWHCDGPITSTAAVVAQTTLPATTTTSHDDHEDHDDHESGTGTLAPSPTESVGCESHGDHWHCDGPASTSTLPDRVLTATSDDHDDDDHDHPATTGTGSLIPSPTESVGCEAHGDHWHCDGPRVTSTSVTGNTTLAATTSAATTTSGTAPAQTTASGNDASSTGKGFGILGGLMLLASFFA
ncbi:hypothetical protein B0O99DRAFT_592301 [Bisporella sp. PMI_857]|nr:hypothetical protein B0O99DRAFT_592301 [Bisporella sp. PMI_857]